jgi:hypothetical protein
VATVEEPTEIPAFGSDGTRFYPVTWTPDSRHIAGSLRAGHGPLILYDTSNGSYRTVPLDFDLTPGTWLDARRFLSVREGQIVSVDLELGNAKPVVPRGPRSQPQLSPVVTADRTRLYMIVDATEADLLLMTIQ